MVNKIKFLPIRVATSSKRIPLGNIYHNKMQLGSTKLEVPIFDLIILRFTT